MSFRLDPERKNSEIHRLLPLLGPFAQDFAGIQSKLSKAFVKLEDIDAIKEAVYLQNRNKDNNNYIEDLQENAAANFPQDDNSSYSYLSMKKKLLNCHRIENLFDHCTLFLLYASSTLSFASKAELLQLNLNFLMES